MERETTVREEGADGKPNFIRADTKTDTSRVRIRSRGLKWSRLGSL